MHGIRIRFVMFQLLLSFISLLLLVIIALDFSKNTEFIDRLVDGIDTLMFLGCPIMESIFYNLVHLSNINRLENSDESIVSMCIVLIISILLYGIYTFINLIMSCNLELQLLIYIINVAMFIPQIITMCLRNNELPALREQLKIQRNKNNGYLDFSKFY